MGKLIDTVGLNEFKNKFIAKILNEGGRGVPTGGTADQILRSNGDGTSRWDSAATSSEIGSAVTSWLNTNVPTGTTVAIDKSLTVENAAAEAKTTGQKLSELTSAFAQYTGASDKLNIGEYEKGGISNDTGANSTFRQACRARTINNTIALCDYRIGVFNDANSSTNFWCMIAVYNDGVFDSSSTIYAGNTYTIKKGQEYRLLIGDTTRQASTSVIDLSELVGHVTIESVFTNAFPDAASTDVGKALVVKTVADNLVVEYEYTDVNDVQIDPTLSNSGDAADAKATGDDIQNLRDSFYAENGIVDFTGLQGTVTQSGISVTQKGNLITLDGAYTASARRRFNLSGQLENSTSAIPANWYTTAIGKLKSNTSYIIKAKLISGSCTITDQTLMQALNVQIFDTNGTAGLLNAYFMADGYFTSMTVLPSSEMNIGCVALTVNKGATFNDFTFYIVIEEAEIADTAYVDGENGSDLNGGTKYGPYKTIDKAISAGARNLIVTPGVYTEKISINGGELKIVPWVDGQTFNSSVPYRPKIELIYGAKLTVSSAGNNIYTAPFTAASGTNMYKVFVGKTVSPTTQGSLALEYNAMLVGDKPNGTSGNNRKRLYTPVLTENELSEQGTFYYDGTTVKFHPWDNVLDDNYYIPNDDALIGLSLQNMSKVHLEDVRIIGCYNYCAYLQECDNVTINACEFAYSGKGMGLGLDNCNARVSDCHASACSVDGFNLHKYGYSEFYDCTSVYNGDDGISHHQGCTGIIDGGEWAYNGSGGITPAFGCSVDVQNVYCHHNLIGLQFLGSSGNRRSLRCTGCLLTDNSQSDLYANFYDITAWNCAYGVKEIGSYATITEYNNKILE